MWKINDDFLSDTKAVFSKQMGFPMEMQMVNIHCAILTKNTLNMWNVKICMLV